MKAQVKKIATRGTAACALASAMAFAAPTLAFAAEKETAGIPAILPAMDEFIPMLVAFLILLAILAKFGWPMFNGILEKRETTIREALEKSEQARIEAERVLAEYQDKLIEARQEAATIISEAKQQAEAQRAATTAKAQEEAEKIIAKSREAMQAEKNAAIAELQASVADIACAAMTRVVQEDFTDADHRRLIEKSIEEIGTLNA